MTEIYNIITPDNKLSYAESAFIPVDGVNYFNDTYHLVESHNYTHKMTGNEIVIRFTPSDTLRYEIAFCHVHGTITKDILSSISFYSINNRSTVQVNEDQVPNTIAIPANPNSNIDYIDYIWIPKPDYNEIYVYFKTHAANNDLITSSQVSLDITYDFYCL